VVAQAEAMGLDVPAAGGEERQGDVLASNSSELARIFPFGGRSKSADAWHGERIGSADRCCGIPAVRRRTKSWGRGEALWQSLPGLAVEQMDPVRRDGEP
jgi:hypothetical protein